MLFLVTALLLFCSDFLPGAEADRFVQQESSEVNEPDSTWQHPKPPAAREYVKERQEMIRTQLAHPRDSRTPVQDEKVLAAMELVPRHAFVPSQNQKNAYQDRALPIGYGQTISQPYIVGLMSELLELDKDSRVLEIGTGSGYQAAVLAHLTPHVYSIEIVEPLAKSAKKTLEEQGYQHVKCRHGDGYLGWEEAAPFDAIIVTCAPDHIPEPLWDQLKKGGRIVIPVGEKNRVQELVVVEKDQNGNRKSRSVMAVRFVPLTRESDS